MLLRRLVCDLRLVCNIIIEVNGPSNTPRRPSKWEVLMSTPYRILVVDDDENLGHIMAETLIAAGYEVQTADDGLHGYLRYLEQQPEIVLTDIEMPELDGLEMMRCIRAINP